MRSVLRRWRVPVVAVFVAGAVALALESHALATARAANDRDAVRGLLVVSGTDPHGRPAAISSRERAFLGLDGMPALRRAIDALAARRAAKRRSGAHVAEQTLDGVLRSNAPAGTRSQAANLLGILVVRDSVTTGSSAGMTRATRLFRRAIALEPQNESAQFNLELVLSLGGGKSQAKTAKTAGGGTGAGSDAAGSGY